MRLRSRLPDPDIYYLVFIDSFLLKMYENELARILAVLSEGAAEALPLDIGPLPDDPQAQAIIYKGILDLVSPMHESIVQALEEYRSVINEWRVSVTKTRAADREAAEALFNAVIARLDPPNVLTAARARRQVLAKAKVDYNVKFQAARVAIMPDPIPERPAPPANRYITALPKTEIPLFEGKPVDFLPFWQLFESLVDNQTTVPPVQKLGFLLSRLKGEPRDLLA